MAEFNESAYASKSEAEIAAHIAANGVPAELLPVVARALFDALNAGDQSGGRMTRIQRGDPEASPDSWQERDG